MVSSNRRVIWIVDDCALDADAARRLFEHDHTVRVFADGSAVLEALTSEAQPDLLILDWIMPGISGVDVCRFLRAGVCGTEHIAILLLTAHKNKEQIVEGFQAGANDYLAKPYFEEELRARVEALLRAQELLERAERAEASNRLLLEHAPDARIIVDANRQVCFVNEAAIATFDMSSEHLLKLRLEQLLPSVDVSALGSKSVGLPADVQIGSRVFSPSARVIPDDGRIALLLHDVTQRRSAGPANAKRESVSSAP